jgi:hypothetical protein
MDKIETEYLIAISIAIFIACGLSSINSLTMPSKSYYLILNISVIILLSCLIFITNKKIKYYNSIKELKK